MIWEGATRPVCMESESESVVPASEAAPATPVWAAVPGRLQEVRLEEPLVVPLAVPMLVVLVAVVAAESVKSSVSAESRAGGQLPPTAVQAAAG